MTAVKIGYMAMPGIGLLLTNMYVIDRVVCNYFNLKPDEMRFKTRKREILTPRHVAMYFSKEMTRNSLAAIGEYFGGFDHATVLHASKSIKNLIDTDKNFRMQITSIKQSFNK